MSGLISKKSHSRRQISAAESAEAQIDKLFAKIQADFQNRPVHVQKVEAAAPPESEFDNLLEAYRRSEESVLKAETEALRSALDARESDHRSSIAHLERIRSLHAEQTQIIAKLEGERDQLRAQVGEQETKIRSLQKTLAEHEDSIFKNNLVHFEALEKAEGKLAAVTGTLREMQTAHAAMQNALQARDEKMIALTKEIEDKSAQIQTCRRAEADLREAFAQAQAALMKRQSEMQAATREREQYCADLETRAEQERKRAERAESEAARAVEKSARDAEYAVLRLKAEFAEEREKTARESAAGREAQEIVIRELQAQLAQTTATIKQLESERAVQLRLREERDGEMASLEQEFESVSSEAAGLRAEVQNLTAREMAVEEEVRGLQKNLAQMTEAGLRKDAQVAALFEQIGEKDKTIENLRAESETERQIWREEKSRMQSELEDKRAMHAQLSSLQADLAEERMNVRKLIEIRDEHYAEEQKVSDKKSDQLRQRERQLRHYAQILSGEKAELSRVANQLMREIRAAQAANPLSDYLAVTQFELTKLEIQLKTTPAINPQRPALEDSLAKLVQQREFLTGTMSASKEAAERQLQSLNRIVGTGVLAPLPPLPVNTSGKDAE